MVEKKVSSSGTKGVIVERRKVIDQDGIIVMESIPHLLVAREPGSQKSHYALEQTYTLREASLP